MRRLFPHSLFGQTLLILLAGLLISHLIGSLIYSTDREDAVRAVGGFATAQRIANLTRLVQETEHDRRQRIVAALNDPSFHVSLSTQPPKLVNDDGSPVAEAIREFLVDQLALGPARQPRVAVASNDVPAFRAWRPMMGPGPMMHGFGAFGPFGGFRDLRVAMPLADGQWLSFTTAVPASGPALSRQFLISMALVAMILIAVSVWVVRRVTAPLRSLSAAAERLGADLNAPPLPEAGTIETRKAAHAFNTMQARLRGLIENRTRMLAAISHDLRTPLTLLRLRAENVSEAAERDKMLGTIVEMDAMLAETLRYARDEATAEPRRRLDISALLASVVDDMADAGAPVSMQPAQPVICECQPAAIKRAFTNLLDNAVKYGKRAKATMRATPKSVEVTIDDEGPGIPEDALKRVFEPFYRVEGSRSRDTGGIGLGLAIALSIIQGHGGQLTLTNRPEGGLRAAVSLPIAWHG
jgi:signal transduction histidine kinase